MGVYRDHQWHVLELPAVKSKAAKEFLNNRQRTVSVYFVPGNYPDSETLGNSCAQGGGISSTPNALLLGDRVIAYLREHGPSEVSTIARALDAPNKIHRYLRDNHSLFETTGERGHWGADVWRLKAGAI